jgi:hypothetical protein
VERRDLRFRYEDLVSEPTATLRALADLAGVATVDPALTAAGEVVFRTTHQVSGNPVRFRRGPVPLTLDDAWVTQMRPLDRHIAGALTAPLRQRYGYRRS